MSLPHIKFVKNGAVLLFILLVDILIFYSPLSKRGYLLYADSLPYTLNFSSFNHIANFVFTEKFFGLVANPVYVMNFSLLFKIFYYLSKFITPEQLTVWYVFLPFTIFSYVLYFSFKSYHGSAVVAAIQVLLYIFSITTFDLLFTGGGPIWSYIGGLIFFNSFQKYIDSTRIEYLLILPLASFFGLLNIAFFYSILLACAIYFVTYAILSIQDTAAWKKKMIQSIVGLFVASIICVLVNAFWILPTLTTQKTGQDTYSTNQSLLRGRSVFSTPLNNFQMSYVFRYEPTFKSPYSYFNSNIYKITFYIFLIWLFYGIFRSRLNDKYKSILLVFILLFSFSLGTNFPLWNLFSKIPGWFFLRDPLRLIYLLWYMLLILAGHVFQSKLTSFANDKPVVYLKFGGIAVYLCFAAFVFFKSDIWSFYKKYPIPSEYFTIKDYLSRHDRQSKGMLILPEFGWYQRYTWMDSSFYLPIIDEAFFDNPLILPFIGRTWVPAYFYKFYNGKVKSNDYSAYLGRAGVKYVLLHTDTLSANAPIKIEKDKKMRRVIKGKYLSLYEINDYYYYPLISSPNLVAYSKINPTKYSLELILQDREDLELNLPFNTNWNLYIEPNKSNKQHPPWNFFEDYKYPFLQPVSRGNGAVSQNRNTWTISKKKLKQVLINQGYSISSNKQVILRASLVYTPQSYFYWGKAISYIAVIICLLFLLYRLYLKMISHR